jgi:hypothetical protein
MTPADHLDTVPALRRRRPCAVNHHYTELFDADHSIPMANNAEASGLRIFPLSI